jgi:hypothetical protein
VPRSTRERLKSNRHGIVPARGWLLAGGGFAISAIVPAHGPAITASAEVAPATPANYAASFPAAPLQNHSQPRVDARPQARTTSAPAIEARRPASIRPVAMAVLQDDRPLPSIARPVTIEFALSTLPEVSPPEAIEDQIVVSAPASPNRTGSAAHIAQLSTIAQSRDPMPQVSLGRELSSTGLADATAAMQVALPSRPAFTDEERARLLAGAPESMVVRIDGIPVGEVAIALTDTRAVAVQLGDLLDLVAERMPPERYDRLRQSSATATFVTLDRLRDAGISVQYDAAYDELRMSV